ncbi:MAG TPA: SDR family oxidoreductase [Thermomicrobiales bacterium]|nr:SDR family oxidoreductase [Thermomicrobiales bacterium]
MQLKPIQDQVVVVLGASSGIGRESARQLASRGAKVVVAARSGPGLDSLVREIKDAGGEATAVICDATDFAQVERVAEIAVEAYGRIDTWVNVCAVAGYASFEDTSLEDLRQIFDVNVMGYVHGARAALPHLRREGRGALISIASVESNVAIPLHSHYAATKHAIEGLMDGLRRELMADGAPISVTTIKPGSINTPFFTNAMNKLTVKPQGPPPIYQPSVVAECVLYAAEHPVRDLYAGGAARMMALTQMLAPGLMGRMLSRAGIPAQETDDTATGNVTGNLYEPSNDDRVEGDFSDQASAFSPYTWLQTHPAAKMAVIGGAIVGIGAVLSRGDD